MNLKQKMQASIEMHTGSPAASTHVVGCDVAAENCVNLANTRAIAFAAWFYRHVRAGSADRVKVKEAYAEFEKQAANDNLTIPGSFEGNSVHPGYLANRRGVPHIDPVKAYAEFVKQVGGVPHIDPVKEASEYSRTSWTMYDVAVMRLQIISGLSRRDITDNIGKFKSNLDTITEVYSVAGRWPTYDEDNLLSLLRTHAPWRIAESATSDLIKHMFTSTC